MAWRFYVYAITDHNGVIVYVGKGSGERLAQQRRTHRATGHEIARFKRERDAYKFEIQCIEELKPCRNKHQGGNGPCARRATRQDAFERICDRLGTRTVAARILLSVHAVAPHLVDLSKLDEIRRVAYGPR